MALLHWLAMLAVPFAVAALVELVLARRAIAAAKHWSGVAIRSVAVRGRISSTVTTRWRSTSPRRMVDAVALDARPRMGLTIETASGIVKLDGRIEAAGGTRIVWDGLTATVTIAAGTPVTASGRIEDDRLVPSDNAIRLVAVVREVIVERPFAQRAVRFAALPFLWLPIGAAIDWHRVAAVTSGDSIACANDGACGVVPTWRVPGEHVVRGWLLGAHYRSGPRNEADCAASKVCGLWGACRTVGGACEPIDDGDCQTSLECHNSGKCSRATKDGAAACVAAKREDCAFTEACRLRGLCTPVDGRCVARGDDCKATEACTKDGLCTAESDACSAEGHDCEASRSCHDDAACAARDGKCKTTDESCRATADCLRSGRCTAVYWGCIANDDADCAASDQCVSYGFCTASEHLCKQDEGERAACWHSRACALHGACSGDGMCAPRSDRDCEASLGCKDHGACKLIDGRCRKTCADDVACKLFGLCALVSGKCVAGSDADCRQSAECKHNGACTRTEKGACTVARDEDCWDTEYCHVLGYCSAKDGRCDFTKDEDAQAVSGGSKRTARACAESAACRAVGECSVVDEGCTVGSDADCAASAACKAHGWCKAVAAPFTTKRKMCFSRALSLE